MFCLTFSVSIAQEVRFRDDTVNIQYLNYTSSEDFQELPYTELDGFHHYRPYGKNRLPIARLGNIGLPTHVFGAKGQDWDIDANLGGYQAYLMKKSNLRLYQASRPFTSLNYANGAESEQLFSVFHTQNMGEGLNLSLEYRRTVSEGFFQNQLTSHTQFNTTLHFHSRNQKYAAKGYFYINDLESQENGGINLTSLEDNSVLQDVQLNNAQNQSRSLGFGFQNAYDVWMLDSNKNLLHISHELDWARSFRLYKDQLDPAQPQYPSFFLDSSATADSSFAEVLSNTLKFELFNAGITVGFRNEYYQYFQNFLLDRHFSSNYILFQTKGTLFGNVETESILEKGISGFHQDELDWKTSLRFKKFKGIRPTLLFSITEKQADFFVQNQRSNQHFFEEDFETSNMNAVQFIADAEQINLELEVGFQQMDNFIFYDTLLTAKQLSSSFSNFYMKLAHHWNFWKSWNFLNRFQLQNLGDEEVMPLPTLFSYHSFYFEKSFFEEALKLQTGFDFFYMSEYQGYAYSPALTQFHLRNGGSALGGSGQLDFFLNLRIEKAARLFFKVENLLNDQFEEDNFRVQGYAIPSRAFKVGFSWRMIN